MPANRILVFQTDQGDSIGFEIAVPSITLLNESDVTTEGQIQHTSGLPSPNIVMEHATESLESKLDGLKRHAETIIGKLANLSVKPREIEIEFGLKVGGKIDTIIASGQVEAHYVVKLKWVNDSSTSSTKAESDSREQK